MTELTITDDDPDRLRDRMNAAMKTIVGIDDQDYRVGDVGEFDLN